MGEYKSTISELERFIESDIWKDLSREYNLWIEDIRNDLESIERTDNIELVRSLQGSLKALRNVLRSPEVIIENIKEDRERKE